MSVTQFVVIPKDKKTKPGEIQTALKRAKKSLSSNGIVVRSTNILPSDLQIVTICGDTTLKSGGVLVKVNPILPALVHDKFERFGKIVMTEAQG